MGIAGSITAKAYVDPILSMFTTWGEKELNEVFKRSKYQLSDTFALRYHEFTFLLDHDSVSYSVARPMFDRIFDRDRNMLVDKFELLCVLTMLSTLTSNAKVSFLFEIFNFNEKGYLSEAETSLMIRTVITGIYKADPSIGLPTNTTFEIYIADALSFATEKGVLLRSELIRFSREVRETQEFMESWRGIASLVLIADGYHWRDPFFPAMNASITPSRHWLKFGLPPVDFVYWIRREHIGENGGCLALFGHTETVLKTSEKRMVLGGGGLLGNGTLKQGLLADRWILNAISMVIMRPCIVKELFALTFQEDLGRFNVRIFEGGGWRSIFVDDRIPCSPYGLPLFASSSDPYECWVQILEKAIAKYLFSYGHLANCSPRPDSSLHALRWLTGGHVLKLSIEDFDWNSIDEETIGVNGVAFLEEMLHEGALVSVGRSETNIIPNSSCAIYTASLTIIPRPDDSPPHGRLMSIIRVYSDPHGYKHIILRDPWGLEQRVHAKKCDGNAPEGYKRTFSVQVEDFMKRYDCLVVCRYPDSLRKHAESEGFIPWKNLILNAPTNGPKNPSRFKLVVGGVNERSMSSLDKSRGKYKADRHKSRTEGQRIKTELAKNPDDFVDISVTLSSTEDWAIVGDQKLAKPQLRMHLWPDQDTLKKIRDKRKSEVAAHIAKRHEKLLKIKANTASNLVVAVADDIGFLQNSGIVTDAQRSNLETQPAMKVVTATISNEASVEKSEHLYEKEENTTVNKMRLNDDVASQSLFPPTDKDLGSVPRTYVETTKKGINGRRSVFHSPMDFIYEPRNRLPTDEMIDNETFEYKIRSARSWQSHSFKLFPGTYYILGDVESENTQVVKHGLNLNREDEISERPWAEFKKDNKDTKDMGRNGTNTVWMQLSSTGNFTCEICTEEECNGNFDNDEMVREVRKEILGYRKQIEHKSVELNNFMVEQKEVDAIKDFRILRSKPHVARVSRLKEGIPKLTQEVRDLEAVLTEKNGEWGKLKRAWIDVKEDVWPLMVETQADVASRELMRMVDEMRNETSGMKSAMTGITKRLSERAKALKGITEAITFMNRSKGGIKGREYPTPLKKTPSKLILNKHKNIKMNG